MNRTTVSGRCSDRFTLVGEQFERNFAERGELGASVCVIHKGHVEVDLFGGSAEPGGKRPWTEETVAMVFSCGKAAVALCVHMLASRGNIELDAPVADYWPGFAREGKSEITVRMLLNHQAGVPGFRRALAPGELCDFGAMVRQLESEGPLWLPGTRYGYHAMTFGWSLGELVRRVSGASVGEFFAAHVADPLSLDFWIGLPAEEEKRVAEIVLGQRHNEVLGTRFNEARARGGVIQVRVANSLGDMFKTGVCNSRLVRRAEIPAVNAITNARGLAGMFAPLSLGGRAGDLVLVDEHALVAMTAVESAGAEDAVELNPMRFSAGFEKAPYGKAGVLAKWGTVYSEDAFGHSGMGGSLGFADRRRCFAFGYVMNRQSKQDGDDRCQRLIDATYESLGFHSKASGKWR